MVENCREAVTAVIPAFNEEDTIGGVVQKTRAYVGEVVVIDDGSTDMTAQIAQEAGATVLRHSLNAGYGAALASGFDYVRNNGAKILVVLDGDGQHDPADIPRMLQPIIDGVADIVTGSRFINKESEAGIPGYRRFGIGIVNRAWKLASGTNMTDTQCGFRAYSREAVDRIDIRESDMSVSLEILDEATENELRIKEVPVSVKYGENTSTMKPGEHGMELVNYVLRKVREEHPLLIFGGVGIILVSVGIAFGIFTLNSYFESRFLPFGPTIIAGLATYVGTLMIFGGLILNAIQALASKLEADRKRMPP